MNQRLSQLNPAQRAALARRLRGGGSDEPVLERRGGSRDTFPLGLDQERLWLLNQLDPLNTTYNISVGLRFRGELEVEALRLAAGDVVRHHELLRSTMHERGGEPLLRVHDDLPPGFEEVDLTDVTADRREDALAERIRAHTGVRFDLEAGPLLRFLVARLGERDYQIVETMHHSVTDQWSYVRLNAQLVEHYRARTEGRPAVVPDLPVQYGDFALWQRQWYTGERREQGRAFWRDQLRDAPTTLHLPYDATPDTASRSGAHHYFLAPADIGAAFVELARAARTTLATALLAVYAGLLYAETGLRDLVIGVPSATRRPGTENLVGFLLTNVPLRLRLPDRPTPRDLLDLASRASAAVAEYREVPFSEIVDAVAPERSQHRYPLVQTMHLVLDFEESVFDVPGAEVYGTEVEDGVSPMDITVAWWHARDTLYGRLEYRTALFHPSTIDRLANGLLELLARFVDAPDTPLRPGSGAAFPLASTGGAAQRPAPVAPPDVVRRVHQAWAAVLGEEPADPGTSFFEAGGTSVLAVRLAHALREVGLEASMRDVYLSPRPAALAAALAARGRPEDHHGGARAAEGLLSAEQEDLLAFEPDAPQRWTHSVVLHAAQPLAVERLRAAVAACVAAHPVLSSRFVGERDGVRMRPGGEWLWSVEAADADDAQVVDAQVARFDLTAGRLFAAALVPAPEGARLVLTANHLVVDGLSWLVLAEDLAAAYRGTELTPERGSYAAYSAALRDADLSVELPFWHSQVAGLAGGRRADGGLLVDEREITVTGPAVDDALDQGSGAGAALRTAALTCAARGVARLLGDDRETVVDVVAHGREPVGDPTRYDLARGVGYYACAYPLRLSVDLARDAAAAVPATGAALAGVPQGGKGWGVLNSAANPVAQATGEGHRRPAASFNYVGASKALHEVTERLFTRTTEWGRRPYPGARRDHLVAVVVGVENGRAVMRWQYDNARLTAAAVTEAAERAMAELPAALAAISRRGSTGISLASVNELFAELHRRAR